MSDVDFDYLYGGSAYAPKAEALLSGGATLVIVTRGGKGVIAWHKTAGCVEVPAPKVDVVDTIGAGDTFQGTTLVALKEAHLIEREALEGATAADIANALGFGVKCAAITCSRAGANPPWRRELDAA